MPMPMYKMRFDKLTVPKLQKRTRRISTKAEIEIVIGNFYRAAV